jgi:hypothetical protein
VTHDTESATAADDPEPADGARLSFTGADNLLALIVSCLHRPAPRLLRRRPGREQTLSPPVIWLIPEGGTHTAVLRDLTAALQPPRGHRVPHALVVPPGPAVPLPREAAEQAHGQPDAEKTGNPGELSDVVRWLADCANRLSDGRNTHEGQFPFRRFRLAYWLMLQDLGQGSPRGVLRRQLRIYHRVSSPFLDWLSHASKATLENRTINPAWPGIFNRKSIAWALGNLPAIVLWIRRHKSCPGAYGWFLRQPYLSPEDPGNFLGWAERLTAGQRPHEPPGQLEQLDKLMVHAFLEDLRCEYRRWPSWMWRRWRSAYPVLLLDHISAENQGERVLGLISTVRNETYLFDPAVVIAAPDILPGQQAAAGACPAKHADAAGQRWRREAADLRRLHTPVCWDLSIVVPGEPDPGAAMRADNERARLGDLHRPLRTRRIWYAASVAVLLVLAVIGYGTWRNSTCGAAVLPWTQTYLAKVGTECIGVTGNPAVFQDPSPDGPQDSGFNATMSQVAAKIEAQNEYAVQHPGHYVTVVYFAILDSATPSPFRLVAEREALEGIAVAQSEQQNQYEQGTPSSGPLLRVLFANGGTSMAHGVQAARLIAARARRDPSIVAVVGLDQSRKNTLDSIDELGRDGIPVVADSLSADELTQRGAFPLYFQISPPNRREAAVIASFVSRHLAAERAPAISRWAGAFIVSSADPGDVYSASLARDLARQLAQRGWHSRDHRYQPGDFKQAGVAACGRRVRHAVVIYAGRAEDFESFLSGVNFNCPADPPVIIADDDVTRFVANASLRGIYSGIRYYYASFAFPTGPSACPSAGFYHQLGRLFRFECSAPQGRSLDGHAELAYDTTEIVLDAAGDLGEKSIPLTPGDLWGQLSNTRYGGAVSGPITFGGRTAQHYPIDKAIGILRIPATASGMPTPAGVCGLPPAHLRQAAWCPPAGS